MTEGSSSMGEAVEEGLGGYAQKAKLNSTLAALLADPILADVPRKPSLSDVDTLVSLELGSAMRISVLKLDGTSIDVAVMNSATVKDLKLAIKKEITEAEQYKMGHRHISWCILFPASSQRIFGSILKGENTASFMGLTREHDPDAAEEKYWEDHPVEEVPLMMPEFYSGAWRVIRGRLFGLLIK